jgi:hypothetical protein
MSKNIKSTCRNCEHWFKTNGTIKHNDDRGSCEFLNSRIHDTYANCGRHYDVPPPQPAKKNNSLVINLNAEASIEIGNLEINTTDPNQVYRHAWVWTDGLFYCNHHTRNP